MDSLRDTCVKIAGIMIAGSTAIAVAKTVIDAMFEEMEGSEEDTASDEESRDEK